MGRGNKLKMRILLLILLSLANVACSQKIENQQAVNHPTPIEYGDVATNVLVPLGNSSPKIISQSDTYLLGQSGYAYKLKINNQEELIFLNYNKNFKLYSEPRLSKNGVISKIEGYDDGYTGIESIDIKISENKHYVKMDAIIKGYVEISDNERWLYENYQCVIIDIKKSKVVWSGVERCDGEWKDDQWISNEQVEFDGE